MRISLALLATLLLMSVGSSATAGTSQTPQNGLIAVAGTDGLKLVDPATGKVTSIPKTDGLGEPAWSPDGTLLAVTEWIDGGADLYTMKPDGSERRLLLYNGSSPSWSPDGKRMVFVRDGCLAPYGCSSEDDTQSVLATVDAEGNDVLELTTVPGYVTSAEWAPDGKQIAFLADDELRLISADGAEDGLRTITKGAGTLSWSPDSTKLAFDRTAGKGQAAVVVLHLATGREATLPGRQQGAMTPVWSPDGTQLAFLSLASSASPVSGGCGEHFTSQLWVMETDGANARPLAKGDFYDAGSWARAVEATAPAADEPPTPQPESTPPGARDPSSTTTKPDTAAEPKVVPKPAPEPVRKALVSKAAPKSSIAVRGSNAIYLVDPNTGESHKVADTADMIAPAWSPDGSLLAVERVEKGGPSSIYTIRLDGSHPQLVVKNASSPSWSPDGDRIFAVRNECSTPCEPEDDEANVLYSVRPDGSDLQRVEEADAYDPRELAWRTDGSPLWFFEDGTVDGPGSFDTSAAAWSPDETRIAFIGALGPTDDEASADTVTAGLWIVSADGGSPELLLKGASGWPSWPSDGR